MTLANDTLAERFIKGVESGSASRMEIRVIDGVRCVVGHGWAVLAADVPDVGLVLFGDGYATDDTDVGWAGYGPGTTTKHLQLLKGAFEEWGRNFTVADVELRTPGRGRRGDRPRIDRLDQPLAAFVREHETDPREHTGYHYRKSA